MAYSNGRPAAAHSSPPYSSSRHPRPNPFDRHANRDGLSVAEELFAGLVSWLHMFWVFTKGPVRRAATAMALHTLRQFRRNLVVRRLLSAPHLLVAIWLIVILWGERWVFHTKVERCNWANWENWVSDCPPRNRGDVVEGRQGLTNSSPPDRTPTTSSSSPTPNSSIRTRTRADRGPSRP
jgi:hypothetical protein